MSRTKPNRKERAQTAAHWRVLNGKCLPCHFVEAKSNLEGVGYVDLTMMGAHAASFHLVVSREDAAKIVDALIAQGVHRVIMPGNARPLVASA